MIAGLGLVLSGCGKPSGGGSQVKGAAKSAPPPHMLELAAAHELPAHPLPAPLNGVINYLSFPAGASLKAFKRAVSGCKVVAGYGVPVMAALTSYKNPIEEFFPRNGGRRTGLKSYLGWIPGLDDEHSSSYIVKCGREVSGAVVAFFTKDDRLFAYEKPVSFDPWGVDDIAKRIEGSLGGKCSGPILTHRSVNIDATLGTRDVVVRYCQAGSNLIVTSVDMLKGRKFAAIAYLSGRGWLDYIASVEAAEGPAKR